VFLPTWVVGGTSFKATKVHNGGQKKKKKKNKKKNSKGKLESGHPPPKPENREKNFVGTPSLTGEGGVLKQKSPVAGGGGVFWIREKKIRVGGGG